jgi:hypothetical protein
MMFPESWSSAQAYERRDVGGETRSPESAALNDQAYETNNRLEREGLVLETAQQQKANLMSALSDYSYSPSTSSNTKGGKKEKESGKNKPVRE